MVSDAPDHASCQKDSHGRARLACLSRPDSAEYQSGEKEKAQAANQRWEHGKQEQYAGCEHRCAIRPREEEPGGEEPKKDRPPVQGIETHVSNKDDDGKTTGDESGQGTSHPSHHHESSVGSPPVRVAIARCRTAAPDGPHASRPPAALGRP